MWLIFVGIAIIWTVLDFIFSSGKSDVSPNGHPNSPRHSGDEAENEMLSALASSMTIGVYCALGDGNLDNRELATLRRWKDEFVRKTPPEISSKIGASMEAEIQNSLRGVSEDHLHRACRSQQDLPDEYKTMTMGLAFEIVAADRKVESSEMACLQKVARLLSISDETFRRLEEKHLRPIQLTAATSGQANGSEQEKLLGIDPSWPKERKLAQLTSEFTKYNARMQTARDDNVRAQCRKMLEIIADLREELLTGRKPNRTPAEQPRTTSGGSPRPAPTPQRPASPIPGPVGSKDEILIGVDLNLPPRQKLAFLDGEEARWKGRMTNHLPPAAMAKCETALQAIRRLRNVYQAQL